MWCTKANLRYKENLLPYKHCLRETAILFETFCTRIGVACVTWDRTSSYFILSVRHPHDFELCVRALCPPRMKKREESEGEALAVHFDDGAKDEICAERKFKERYICYRSHDSYIKTSLRLLHHKCASELNWKLYESAPFSFLFSLAIIIFSLFEVSGVEIRFIKF